MNSDQIKTRMVRYRELREEMRREIKFSEEAALADGKLNQYHKMFEDLDANFFKSTVKSDMIATPLADSLLARANEENNEIRHLLFQIDQSDLDQIKKQANDLSFSRKPNEDLKLKDESVFSEKKNFLNGDKIHAILENISQVSKEMAVEVDKEMENWKGIMSEFKNFQSKSDDGEINDFVIFDKKAGVIMDSSEKKRIQKSVQKLANRRVNFYYGLGVALTTALLCVGIILAMVFLVIL